MAVSVTKSVCYGETSITCHLSRFARSHANTGICLRYRTKLTEDLTLIIELTCKRKLEENLPGVRFKKTYGGKNEEKNVVGVECCMWRTCTELATVLRQEYTS